MEPKPEDFAIPCPFCGASGVNVTVEHSGQGYAVQCGPCDAIGPPRHTEKEAVEAWNRRKPLSSEHYTDCENCERKLTFSDSSWTDPYDGLVYCKACVGEYEVKHLGEG